MPGAEGFDALLSSLIGSRIVICMHRKADLDAFCSAYALGSLIPGAIIACPDEPNLPVREFSAKMGVDVALLGSLKPPDFAGMLVVDAGSLSMLDHPKNWEILALIDHHKRTPGAERINAKHELIDDRAPATCQIVSRSLDDSQLNEKTAFALAIGIISDTARFKGGNAESFAQIARMLSISRKEYSDALAIAEPEATADEKAFMLSCAKGAEIREYRGFVIASTVVNGNESDASSFLSEAADIAFAASWRVDERTTRVSARARKSVKIKLNEVMLEIGTKFGASGGGHSKAAGANAKARPEEVLRACVNIAMEHIDKCVEKDGVQP
jgi:bifunctional oligoribonuclease and PAP phosphatase NrnA